MKARALFFASTVLFVQSACKSVNSSSDQQRSPGLQAVDSDLIYSLGKTNPPGKDPGSITVDGSYTAPLSASETYTVEIIATSRKDPTIRTISLVTVNGTGAPGTGTGGNPGQDPGGGANPTPTPPDPPECPDDSSGGIALAGTECECKDLKDPKLANSIFMGAVSVTEENKQKGFIKAKFEPKCSDGKPIKLDQLAKAMGVSYFNWFQVVFDARTPQYILSLNDLQTGPTDLCISQEKANTIPANILRSPQRTGGQVDPPVDGKPWVMVKDVPNFPIRGTCFWFSLVAGETKHQADRLPFYFNTDGPSGPFINLNTHKSDTKITFEDQPCANHKFFEGLPANYGRRFHLQMAAVKLVNNTAKIVKTTPEKVWFNRNTLPPPPAVTGSCESRGFGQVDPTLTPVDADATRVITDEAAAGRLVPKILGEVVPSDLVTGLLEGTGFSYKVVRRVVKPTEPDGTIVEQTPPGWSEVAKALPIEVVVTSKSSIDTPPDSEDDPTQSAGKDCNGVKHGQKVTRVRYKVASGPTMGVCQRNKEKQKGQCNNGTLAFDGTATFAECKVVPGKGK